MEERGVSAGGPQKSDRNPRVWEQSGRMVGGGDTWRDAGTEGAHGGPRTVCVSSVTHSVPAAHQLFCTRSTKKGVLKIIAITAQVWFLVAKLNSTPG